MAGLAETQDVLRVEDLSIEYYTLTGRVYAVSNVSFYIKKGESLCLVGESGSGKSTIGLAIAMSLPSNARISHGRILLEGKDIVSLDENERKKLRGKRVSIIFQDPAATLNPLFTIGQQMRDVAIHGVGLEEKTAAERVRELLGLVGLPDPERILNSYPHQLSGGMLQRINIAIALLGNPSLLVADEPTTMLDVTLQAQILELLLELKESLGLSMLFITHNLGVAAEMCDRTVVLYAGMIMEYGLTEKLLLNPKHPYTYKLLLSVPRAHADVGELSYIPGGLPELTRKIVGCPFAERCEWATRECRKERPSGDGDELHKVYCYHPVDSEKLEKTIEG